MMENKMERNGNYDLGFRVYLTGSLPVVGFGLEVR